MEAKGSNTSSPQTPLMLGETEKKRKPRAESIMFGREQDLITELIPLFELGVSCRQIQEQKGLTHNQVYRLRTKCFKVIEKEQEHARNRHFAGYIARQQDAIVRLTQEYVEKRDSDLLIKRLQVDNALFDRLNPRGPEVSINQQLNVVSPQSVFENVKKRVLADSEGEDAERLEG